ncbi:hypothetical protein K458DRAFT_101119 [Lentithecium fluviatile CBS 122367]|uniref:NACHT-NTPase and P-loop NTPases N-terminal domain-containing protein n=1 Tax=Lentithecium fluviatile CBS 122367 TaxID=1168545 RepID=A0A6G1JJF4_9PLEO|nr:hypothetical protein K458DRAFT_101119 [Lentithecium fluviatile CBS 122367]
MSGLEALGGIAAATQLFAYLFQALFELRDQIKHAPARVQAYVGRLDSLRRTVQYIRDHPIFVTNVVEALLKTILEQVDVINAILHKSFSREPRSIARRLIRLYVERLAEQQIRDSFENLESYKSDLMICIYGTTEWATTGKLLEDGGISLEAVTRESAAVVRKTVSAQGNGAPSQGQALVISGQRNDTVSYYLQFVSTMIPHQSYERPLMLSE